MSDLPVAWVEPEWEASPRVRVVSTLRTGGVSVGAYASLNLGGHVGDDPQAVRENRARLSAAVGLPAAPLWLEQVHGSTVIEHPGTLGDDRTPPQADAAVTFAARQVCSVMTADCLPVVLADRAGTRVGVAHAGWRGLAGGVLEATVRALRIEPRALVAWLGPAISQTAFEVGAEVRAAFLARSAAHADAFVVNAAGRYQADIYALARHALGAAGVRDVSGGGACTSVDSQRFFSFRRDGSTGRMATLAWLV